MIVGRFAPSPTGPLHMGSLVAAVGSYLCAKRAGGKWLLRMEDLDIPRVVTGCADDILRTMEALGFEWDGEVIRQSERSEAYHQAFESLIRKGVAYPCGCSRAEIARACSAPHDEDGETVYPGICRNGLPSGKSARSWRLRVSDRTIHFHDMILGHRSYHLPAACGDFVIKRADGLFAYQLAVVVDDHMQGVNQVVRGSDLLSSTPRQIELLDLLGFETPEYGHLPLVTGQGGAKLSKRDNTVSCSEQLKTAADSANLLFEALSFLGQNPPRELLSLLPAEILKWGELNFLIAAVSKSGGPLHH